MSALIPLSAVLESEGPLVRVSFGPKGLPVAATAGQIVNASPERVYEILTDIEKYAERVPLIQRVKLKGDLAEFALRFKVAFFGVGFSFTSKVETLENQRVTLAYREGEPANIHIQYDIAPLAGEDERSVLFVRIGFDVDSLGWLVKFFLKHHPEIQFGIFPGCALALLESMRLALAGDDWQTKSH
jgi:ribosome-associated toxin RatA of RatAB toxin-antitoxin module